MAFLKKFLAASFWGFLLTAPIAARAENATDATAQIIINEIAASEPSDTEWLKIYNKGETPIDLIGWKFFENNTNHNLTAWRGGNILQPREFAVIANKPEILLAKYPSYAGKIFDSSWSSLKEDGEEIGLKDSSGNFVERFAYPAFEYKPSENRSIGRINPNADAGVNSNWILHANSNSIGEINSSNSQPTIQTPAPANPAMNTSNSTSLNQQQTINELLAQLSKDYDLTCELKGTITIATRTNPKSKKRKIASSALPQADIQTQQGSEQNISQNGDLSDFIKITEILPNPAAGQDEEWIEIFNGGNTDINLGNWNLKDSSKTGKYNIPNTITLQAGEYRFFTKSETKISLNNSDETVSLLDYNETMKDSVHYEKSQKGKSYALIGGINSWEWTDESTPGEENQFFETIEGKIKQVTINEPGVNEMEILSGNSSVIVNFETEVLNPRLAEITMPKGARVTIQAEKTSDGYELRKVERVEPQTAEQTESIQPQNTKFPTVRIWIIGLWAAITAAFLAVFLYRRFRGKKF